MTPTFCLALAAAFAGFEHDGPTVEAAPLVVDESDCCDGLGWYKPQVGDLLLFQSPGALKNIAYFLVGSGGATHSALVLLRPDGSLGMLEAPGSPYPVMISNIPTRLRSYKGRVWVRRRCKPVTPEQSACLTKFACAQEGKSFATLGTLAIAFGHPVRREGKERCLKPEALDREKWFCSEICVSALVVAGLLDGTVVKPRMTDPEDLKTDRMLDLTCGWEKSVRWHRCGPELECWWSRTCCGKTQWWTH